MRLGWHCTLYWCSAGKPGNEAIWPLACTPHWCSLGQPGNKASLYTCSPGEPGMRLAQGLYSVLVLTRGTWEQG